MIEASHVSKIFPDGTKALDDVSFRIEPGEFIAIIGRSGSGKTTLLRHINGTILPTQGNLKVLDIAVSNSSPKQLKNLRRQIGFIFQQFNLVKNLSVLQNVLIGRLGYHSDISGTLGLFSKEDTELALHQLEDVGLEAKVHSRADQLSGGQQQRVAIARAMVQDPKIILADEPMASLDPQLSEVVLGLLKDSNHKKKITVIVNIHVLELARKYATRIIALKAGRIAYDGPTEKLTETKLKEIYE